MTELKVLEELIEVRPKVKNRHDLMSDSTHFCGIDGLRYRTEVRSRMDWEGPVHCIYLLIG